MALPRDRAALVVLLGLLAAAAPAGAQSGTFGEVVSPDDDQVVATLEDGDVPDRWVWLDRDTDDDEDDYDGGQTVYLVDTSSRFSDGDVRVGGGQVDGRRLDDDESLESLGGSLAFLDEDGDGNFDTGDGLYYDVSEDGNRGEVSDLDIHIAGASGSDEEDLDGYSGDFAFRDRDGDGAYDEDDDVYLDTDGDDLLTAADVGIAGEHEGRVLEGSDDAVEHPLSTSPAPDRWTFVDADRDGGLDGDEAVFLSQSSSEVQVGDVRVANPIEGSVGDLIEDAGDDDVGDALESLSGQLAFFDEDGDGSLAPPDVLYLDRDRRQSGEVSAQDVRLTGPSAGQLVDSGAAELGNPLVDLDADPALDDLDGDEALTDEDRIVLDVDGDGYVSGGDVELSPDLGRVVRADAPEAIRLTKTSGAPDRLGLVDDDGDGRPDVDEALYLQADAGDVATADVRVAYPPEGSRGSQVRTPDPDAGHATVPVDGDLAYRDHDGDDAFGTDDVLYHDLDDGGSDDVTVGDVVLSGSRAGTVVASGHDELSSPLASFPGVLAFLDADGDDRYEIDDGLVVDTDDDGFLTAGDVWLRGTHAPEPRQPDDSDGSTGDGTDDGSGTPSGPVRARIGAHFSAEANRTVRFVDGFPPGSLSLSVTLARDCEGCSAHVANGGGPPEDAPTPPEGWRVLAHRALAIHGPDDQPVPDVVRDADYGFGLDRDRLGSARPAQVALLALGDDGWTPAPTERRPDGEAPAYEANLSGLGPLAIAADEAPPRVGDPRPRGSVGTPTPAIAAAWSDNRGIDPDSLELRVDGTEAGGAQTLTRGPEGFRHEPAEALAGGPHTVNVTVRDRSGLEASRGWTFRVGNATCPDPPRLTRPRPEPGTENARPTARIEVQVEAGSCRVQTARVAVNGAQVPSTHADGRVTAAFPGSVGGNESVSVTVEVADEGGNPARRTWSVRTAPADPGDPAGSGERSAPAIPAWTLLGALALAARGRPRRGV